MRSGMCCVVGPQGPGHCRGMAPCVRGTRGRPHEAVRARAAAPTWQRARWALTSRSMALMSSAVYMSSAMPSIWRALGGQTSSYLHATQSEARPSSCSRPRLTGLAHRNLRRARWTGWR